MPTHFGMAARAASSLYFSLLIWRRRPKARPGGPSGKTSDPHFGPEVEVGFQGLETGGQRARIFPVSGLPFAERRLNVRPVGAEFGVTCGGRKFVGIGLVRRDVCLQLCSPPYHKARAGRARGDHLRDPHTRIETTAIYASAIGDEERNLARKPWSSLESAIPALGSGTSGFPG